MVDKGKNWLAGEKNGLQREEKVVAGCKPLRLVDRPPTLADRPPKVVYRGENWLAGEKSGLHPYFSLQAKGAPRFGLKQAQNQESSEAQGQGTQPKTPGDSK